ncbi:WcbI family polysaccharide biosynthesis putative acetyltransferase [Microbacterium sp. NPDC091313]
MTTGVHAEPRIAGEDAAVLARRTHYAHFFGDAPAPDGFGVVVGNCQAESLRITLTSPDVPTVRVPAVHELTADDAGRLHGLLARAAFLVVQPIHDDYHDLPLGTRQLRAALPAGAACVVVPNVRFAGLHPFQAALRVPGVDEDPPVVAYHDVRVLAEAAGLPLGERLGRDAVRAIAAESVAELRRREQATDVAASDLFTAPDFALMRTVNHPGNAVWMPLAERVLAALGTGTPPTDPGRPLLAAVQAPREEWVIEAWGSSEPPRDHWVVEGAPVAADEVSAAHREWYRAHPEVVTSALTRLAPLLAHWRAA